MLMNLCEILAWCTKTFGKDCRLPCMVVITINFKEELATWY